ncbi:hypothetical protein JMF89_00225 [Clostridiaceae bacterium UIB06]|uniref:Vitamin B12 dependent methionine synthase n=1 Tax=Clostridium thailandense TaxID=2794346 RepID=A0A949U3F7_9CLOT|nr:hypothetical protein [Clostridium thailandense]MBV7276691.1 hypothetical protein [Clostridium thailandense]MCH5135645.1 hypothetical protein [Clostridiaceae bacterium UIB06]
MDLLSDEFFILKDLKFDIKSDKLLSDLDISNHKESLILKELIEEAKKIAKPRALFRKCTISEKDNDFVIIGGEKFLSKVISANLQKELIAFPYIVTCGNELQQWCNLKTDSFTNKLSEFISQTILIQIHKSLQSLIEIEFNCHTLARVNPGSTIDWNISELKKIFNLLNDPTELIGVSLGDNFYMNPSKTYSGIYFHNEDGYKNCFMCPGDCPLREVPYDKEYYNRKYKNFELKA